MASSTNYLWAEPDNSSLVKNGASDIRTLGNAIDASLWSAGFGQAGKNKIINGDFGIWQRGTSFASSGYTADRWYTDFAGSSAGTISRQAFTAGTAPVSGYEAQYFLRRNLTTGAQYSSLVQRIEDVRTFAGQTVKVSFWAKGTNPTGNFEANLIQSFGSGGSADVPQAAQSLTVTGSWVRYSYTFTLPSITGKTIGTGSYLFLSIYQAASNTSVSTLDIWGVQAEAGSTATPFQTASGGSPQAELAMCQRYYWRWNANSNFATCGIGAASSTTTGVVTVMHPVPMRTVVSAIDGSANSTFRLQDQVTGLTQTAASIEVSQQDLYKTDINVTVSGATQYRFYRYGANNSTSAYLGFSAEL
jgi:hypothetical protein